MVTDSERYLLWSEESFSDLSPTNWKFYSLTYVCLLKVILATRASLFGVVIGQMILSGLACYCLYRLTTRISRSSFSGFIASFMYLAFGEIVQWNTYIMTESLFTSGIIFLMYALHYSRTLGQWALAFLLLIAVSLIRPMGITVLLAALLFIIFRFELLKRFSLRFKVIGTGIVIVIGLVFLYYLLEGNPSVNFYYSRGQIVWGTDTEELRKNSWLIVNNENVHYPSSDLPAYQMFLVFVRDNFIFFSELFIKKLTLFVTHVKPYYSTWHNTYIALFLAMVYFFGFKNIRSERSQNPIAYFALGLFFFNALMVGLSVEAWEGRFLIPVLSPLLVFFANGFEKVFIRK